MRERRWGIGVGRRRGLVALAMAGLLATGCADDPPASEEASESATGWIFADDGEPGWARIPDMGPFSAWTTAPPPYPVGTAAIQVTLANFAADDERPPEDLIGSAARVGNRPFIEVRLCDVDTQVYVRSNLNGVGLRDPARPLSPAGVLFIVQPDVTGREVAEALLLGLSGLHYADQPAFDCGHDEILSLLEHAVDAAQAL